MRGFGGREKRGRARFLREEADGRFGRRDWKR
jgi:hypothetical protein